MHYRNGRQAKNGDVIVSISSNCPGAYGATVLRTGVLFNAEAGNDYCSASLARTQSGSSACRHNNRSAHAGKLVSGPYASLGG